MRTGKRLKRAAIIAASCTTFITFMYSSFRLLGLGDGPAYRSVYSTLRKRCQTMDLVAEARKRGVNFTSIDVKWFGGVRGLGAVKEIKKGEALVSVPREHLFSYSNVRGSLQELWDKNYEIRELDRLVLTLMHEAGKAQGSSSYWDYYLCALPAAEELGPPVLWDAHRLHSYCTQERYAVLCEYVRKRQEYYGYNWHNVIRPLLLAHPQVWRDAESLEVMDYLWAATAVLSRMWNMKDEDTVEFLSNGSHVGSDKWVMAPLAELLNHQPFSGHIQWQDNDVSSGVFQIISDRDYLAGEQVFLSYGDHKCNLQLLLDYGFELKNNTATCPEEKENVTTVSHHKGGEEPGSQMTSAPTPQSFTRSHTSTASAARVTDVEYHEDHAKQKFGKLLYQRDDEDEDEDEEDEDEEENEKHEKHENDDDDSEHDHHEQTSSLRPHHEHKRLPHHPHQASRKHAHQASRKHRLSSRLNNQDNSPVEEFRYTDKHIKKSVEYESTVKKQKKLEKQALKSERGQ